MTDTPDTVEPDAETESWNDSADGESYPEYPANPHNHRFTLSMNGQGPMIVVRANTAEEANAAFEELQEQATGVAMGNAWAAVKAAAAIANGLGATAVPAAPTPPPFGPNVSVPQAPGYQPPPPPPPAPVVQDRGAEYSQSGWYRLNVPFKSKAVFDGLVAQYQLRKGRPSEGGQLSFHKDTKSWYVDPQYAGVFQQFSPVPA